MDGISSARRKYLEGHTFSRFVFLVFIVLAIQAIPRNAMAVNAPSGLTATAISASQINLAWTDNSTDETYFYIERKIGSAGVYSQIALVGANTTSYASTGLSVNTTYYYRVRAYSAKAGYSTYSNAASATTTLQAPSNLIATAITSSQINLSWTYNSTDPVSFEIERKGPKDASYVWIGRTKPPVYTYTDSGLTQNTTYNYKIRASYTPYAGSPTYYSSYSNQANATIIIIVSSAGARGAISPSGTMLVNYRASQTFTMTPNTGYSTTDVVVDTLQHYGSVTTFTFNNITTSHTISASFADVTPPTGSIVINNGAEYTQSAIVSLILNASDNGSGISTMQFSNDNTVWSTPEPYATTKAWLLSPGDRTKTVYVKFTDNAGNSSIASDTIVLYSLTLSNVGISRNTINTAASEFSTIFFTIDAPATVTLKIIPENQGPTGTPVYQSSQAAPAAGAYLFTWDGKNNAGQVVPDEAYIYILEASVGTSAGLYSPPAPTGTGTVNCSQSTGLDPAKNIPMTVTYTPAQPSRVNIVIDWGSQNFKIMDAVAATQDSHTFVWDGRNPSGKLLDFGAKATCSVASLLGENHIITTGDTVRISEVKTDPYMMHLSYGQFTRIKYTVSRDANVTLKLTSPSGAIITLFNNQAQTAGAHEIEWTGIDSADPAGKNMLATEEGDYMVSVQAVNPQTVTISTSRANVRIGY